MYCSKCGVQNSDGAMYCVNCGAGLMEAAAQSGQAAVQPRTSRLAIASLVMGLLCMTCVLWPILVLPAIICGIAALVNISSRKGVLKGTGLAVTGIAVPAVMLFMLPVAAVLMSVLMPALSRTQHIAKRVVCSTNLKTLAAAMIVYMNDNDDTLPLENWCDLLIEKADVSPKVFVCPASNDVIGESSYALNKYIAGRKGQDLPADMVMFFETRKGLESSARNTSVKIRRHYGFINQYDNFYAEKHLVHKERFNQLGGPEDLLLSHDGPRTGCNIAFVDGHVEFVVQDRIPKLKWTLE